MLCCFSFNPSILNTANNIGDDGAISIGNALKENKSLTTFDLSSEYCYFDVNDGCVVSHFNPLILNTDNNIGDDGAISIAESLKMNKSLTTLYLSCEYLYLM